jgi:predicted amidohydrolase YtcJ
VLDRDYFSVSEDDMRRTQPVLTVVGGTVVNTSGDIQ